MTRPSASAPERAARAVVVISGLDGATIASVPLHGARVTVGRLPDVNDIALDPDPQRLISRAGHCTFEQHGRAWFIVDGGSVNGTFLRRGPSLRRVVERIALHDGDVVCVLASVSEAGQQAFFEL